MIKLKSILVLAICMLTGCSAEFKESFSQLTPLREAIIKEYGEKNISVNLQNGNCIGVAFINTRFNNESDEAQEIVRKKPVELISTTFSNNKNIKMAFVSFVVHKKYFFLFNYTDSLNTKFYEKSTDGTWEKKL